MRKVFFIFLAAVLLGKAPLFASCTTSDDHAAGKYEQTTFIPQAPDYNDATMWVRADGDTDGTGADIFYVVSTWEEDWTTEDGKTCHYADVWNPEHRKRMADLEMNKVAAYMSPGNRFFAPFYRHTTIEAWMTQNEDTIRNRTRLSMSDVCAAFDHFQAHRDKSRPLVIAGFSQGGLAVVELLKHIDDETYRQLAAPIYYFTLCAQIQAPVQRIYCVNKPAKVKKMALLMSSYSPNVYDGATAEFRDICNYWQVENTGFVSAKNDEQKTEETKQKVIALAAKV